MDAAAVVESEVRDRVRLRGIDPLADPGSVRIVVDEVLADYAERSLGSTAIPLADGEQVARDVVDAVAGLGPLQQYLDDPSVEELWINAPGRVFIARGGHSELTPTILTHEQVRDLVERMLRPSNRRVDLSSPFVDATLPDGSRIHVVIPDVTREHWAVNVRKFVVRAERLEQLVGLGTLSEHAARFLEACVVAGLNIIVSGGTQAGKTTLLNCLAASIPPSERVVTVEEVFELKVPLPDVVSMQTRQASLEGTGEIRLRRLVKEALRMRPSRIIVGEIRQEECCGRRSYRILPPEGPRVSGRIPRSPGLGRSGPMPPFFPPLLGPSGMGSSTCTRMSISSMTARRSWGVIAPKAVLCEVR